MIDGFGPKSLQLVYIYPVMDLRSYSNFTLLKGVLLSLLGLAFLVWPGKVAKTLAVWAGIILLATGLFSLVYTYRANKTNPSGYFGYILPIAALSGGLIFLIFPRFTLSIFALGIGIWVVLEGLQQIRLSGSIETMGRRPGNWMLVLGIASLLLGLLIVLRPFELVEFMTGFFGVLMLISGIFMISGAFKAR